jgi:hypothetical protein
VGEQQDGDGGLKPRKEKNRKKKKRIEKKRKNKKWLMLKHKAAWPHMQFSIIVIGSSA